MKNTKIKYTKNTKYSKSHFSGLSGVNGFWTFIKCPFSKTSDLPEKKGPEKHVVTIMLSFPFFSVFICDANFLSVLFKSI